MKAQSKTTSSHRSAREPIAAVLLLSDHKLVGELFAAYDKAASTAKITRVASRTSTTLTQSAELDEEVFYPTLYNS